MDSSKTTNSCRHTLEYVLRQMQFAKAMGKPPSLPTDFEGKVRAFNGIMMTMAEKLPPTASGITIRERCLRLQESTLMTSKATSRSMRTSKSESINRRRHSEKVHFR